MDPDERPYSLGWATAGCVEPRIIHRSREDEPEGVVGRSWDSTDQDDLDTWWSMVSAGHLGHGTQAPT